MGGMTQATPQSMHASPSALFPPDRAAARRPAAVVGILAQG